MEEFVTIKDNVQFELVEKKSRFIANLFYVESTQKAENIIKEIRKKYYDAKHNCIAYRIIENGRIVEKASDDGEPSGTAGAPMLNILQKNNLANVLIIVTRYFGGILLGTGGLIVAYKQAAADALDHAEIEERQVECAHKIHFDYPQMNDVMRVLKEENASITDTQYTDGCTVYFEVCKANEARLVKRMTDLRLVKLD